MVRILLTHSPDALENYYGPRALAGLRALAEVRLHTGAEPLAGDALLDAAADCDLIVSYRQSPGPATLFARLPRLVAFVRCAIDTRNIDLAAASDAGVLVTQASAGFVASASEMVIGFMVDLARGITRSTLAYRSGQTPAALMGRQLRGSTLGIIGYGAIGREVARLGVALGMRVLVHDPYVADLHEVADIEPVTLDDLLGAADFVVPLAVATAETENLMDASAFATMKRGACFINVSRGNLVDEAALEAALERGHLGGCAMDVGRDPDQMPSSRLATRLDVLATPHTGGLTPPAIEHQSLETVSQAEAILKGNVPQGALNAPFWRRRPQS